MAKHNLWHHHPAVRTGKELSFGERAADHMRNGMGSWAFVGGFLLTMAIWMLFNRGTGPDPYPFILLNLILSTLAGLQAACMLIAAKRADAISAEVSLHTSQTADSIKQLLEQNTALTEQIHTLTEQVHAHALGKAETS